MAARDAPNRVGIESGPLSRPAIVELKAANTSDAAAVINGVAWLRNSVAMALVKSAGTRLVISGIAPPIPKVFSSETISGNWRLRPASATSVTTGAGAIAGLVAMADSTGALAMAPTPTTAAIPAVRYERTVVVCMGRTPLHFAPAVTGDTPENNLSDPESPSGGP